MKVFIFALVIASAYAQSATTSKHDCLTSVFHHKGLSARGTYDAKTLLNLHDNLPTELQTKIANCKLNLAPAKARCEGAYGKDNCEQIHSAAFQTKCDALFFRVGCCHCAMACPDGYKEDDYHCIKPKTKKTKVFETRADCESGKLTCEQRGNKFTEVCGIQFKRLGVDVCIPVCPSGWHDEGKRCRKPANYRMAQPFFWEQGDN